MPSDPALWSGQVHYSADIQDHWHEPQTGSLTQGSFKFASTYATRAAAASIIIKGIESSGGLTLSRIPFHQASERVAIKGTRCYVTDEYYQIESRIHC